LVQEESDFEFKFFPGTDAGITGSANETNTAVGIRGAIEKRFKIGVTGALIPGIERSDDDYSAQVGLSLDIPLLRGLGKKINLDVVEAARFSIKTAQRSLFNLKVNTVLDTVVAAYNIIKQENFVSLILSQVKRLQQYARLSKIKTQVDLQTHLDVYRAEIRLKDVENELAFVQKSYKSAKDRLKIICAIPVEQIIEINAPLAYEPVRISANEAIKVARNNRIELKQAQDQIAEVQRQVDIARHNTLPQIDLALDYNRFGSDADFTRSYRFDEDRWSVRLLSSTDWRRTSEKVALKKRLLEVKNSRVNLESVKEEIKTEVRDRLNVLQENEEKIRLRKEQIIQAQGKLALADIKFRHGLTDNFDLIESETELQRARVNLITAETDYIVGTYRLRAALGTLLEHRK
jgi:outer membrane protein